METLFLWRYVVWVLYRSPAEYYVKYLMLHPHGYGDGQIADILRARQLDYPGADYLQSVRSLLKPPTGFQPYDQGDTASYQFLQQHRVHKLFFPDDAVREAISLLERAEAKERVEAMLIVKESSTAIVRRLQHINVSVSTLSVDYYAHFFWNMRLVSPAEVRALLEVRVDDIEATAGEDPERLVRHKALKRAMYNDTRFMAATSPLASLGALRLQLRHGLMPSRLDNVRLLDTARSVALIALAETLLKQSPTAATEAKDYAGVVAALSAVLKDQGAPDKGLHESLVGLATDTTTTPHIGLLTAGATYTDGIQLSTEEAAHE